MLQTMGSQRVRMTEQLNQLRASLVVQMVKNPSVVQETWVRSLGWEDPLEKEMPTHFSVLAWKTPWMEEPGKESDMTKQIQSPHSES